MSDKHHRYYKHTKFRQNPRGDPKFLVDLTRNDPINICKCWTQGSLLQNYDAVILLTLRTKKIQEAQTIADLLLTPDDELRENINKEIIRNLGEKICFILEGYDELPYQLHNHQCLLK